jgi:hypothetical protein
VVGCIWLKTFYEEASALEASEVLDVFTPVREDYWELVK